MNTTGWVPVLYDSLQECLACLGRSISVLIVTLLVSPGSRSVSVTTDIIDLDTVFETMVHQGTSFQAEPSRMGQPPTLVMYVLKSLFQSCDLIEKQLWEKALNNYKISNSQGQKQHAKCNSSPYYCTHLKSCSHWS